MSAAPQGQVPVQRTSTWVVIAVIFGCIAGFLLFAVLVLAALLLPAIQAAREAARRNMCMNNLRLVGIALQNYHDAFGSFPPAYVADDKGNPMHSWRVLILPYFCDQTAKTVHDAYKFDEPWNGPSNIKLSNGCPSFYRCPSSTDNAPLTNYVAIVGPDTAWPGGAGLVRRAFTDGLSTTIQVIETNETGIHWMSPQDLTMDQVLQGLNAKSSQPTASSGHRDGVNILMADSSIHHLPNDTHRETLRGLLTPSGGENVRAPE